MRTAVLFFYPEPELDPQRSLHGKPSDAAAVYFF